MSTCINAAKFILSIQFIDCKIEPDRTYDKYGAIFYFSNDIIKSNKAN